MEHTQDIGHPEPHTRPEFEILVNEHEVVVRDHRMTGLEIKRAAIAQHVPIQLDFVLSEELPNGRFGVVGDDEVVTVNKHSKFHAVSPDDNS